MFNVVFYKDKNDKSEIEEYLLNLQMKNDKNSRIKSNKLIAYINMLSQHGTNLGEPYVKHLVNDIWELRPLRDRILFACINNNKIILLNIFMKQTPKTPKSEILKAKRLLNDFIKRSDYNGK